MNNQVKQVQDQGKEIRFTDLWDIFVKRWWIMVLAAVLVVVAMFIIVKVTYVPEYQCKATLYILKQGGDTDVGSSSDFSLALNVVKDCTYILKCHSVLDMVIDNTQIDAQYETLYDKISTKNPDGTRILEVTAKASTPQLAKKIVDSVCVIGTNKITDSFGFQQTSICEEGILDTKPCNKTGLEYYAVAGLISALLVYIVFFMIFLLDDSISTNEEIEKMLGITVLGEVPNFNEEGKSKYGYGKKYYAHTHSDSPKNNGRKDAAR